MNPDREYDEAVEQEMVEEMNEIDARPTPADVEGPCPFNCVAAEVESEDGIHRKACPRCGPPAERPTPITDYQHLLGELAEAREQRDRLAEALRMLRNASLKYKMDVADLEIEDANDALAAVKGIP